MSEEYNPKIERSQEELVSEIKTITEANNKWRENSINLIASENVMSPLAHHVYANSDFEHRYAEGDPFKRFYQGTKNIDKLEVMSTEIFKRLFRANYVDLRSVSGSVSNLAVYGGLCKPGDLIMSVGTASGGHISHTGFGAAGIRGCKTVFMPYNDRDFNIDIDETRKWAMQVKPKLFILGCSLFLFPNPADEIKKIADEIGAYVMYDIAHVAGLVAAGEFYDPLAKGADAVTMSTHKTFPGPQGGAIMANDPKIFKKIKRALFPGLVCSHHLHRVPALGVTALEMEKFGKPYAQQTIKNAQTLAQAMYEKGFNVCAEHKGFTQSHTIAVDVTKIGDSKELAQLCESANIILNKNLLPWDTLENARHPSGVRIGTQEMTHFGMKESEMKYIADLLHKLLIKKEDPQKIQAEVKEFRNKFQKIHYCFDM
jgi:glycine hydroxymethyltransferase